MPRRARMLASTAAAAILAASTFALLRNSDGSSPDGDGETATTVGARLPGAPTAITNACAQAAAHAAFAVQCPARWPSYRGRGGPKARLFEKASDVYLVDVGNGFSRRGGHVFHLLLGGQRHSFGRWPASVDPDLRITTRKVTIPQRGGGTSVSQLPARRIATARVRGAQAVVMRAPPYPAGGLHGGHVVVLWSQDGHGYLVSVHGERLSQRALVLIALAMARSTRPTRATYGENESSAPRKAKAANTTGRSEGLIRSTAAPCNVGERPDYFVPGPARSPLALLGCARLGVSGKPVEFSGNLARIDGEFHFCINPAYRRRAQRGFFIPGICKLDPRPSQFAVRYAAQPRQGVRGYAFVIWGTAGASTSDVVARFNEGRARGAVLKVRRKLARKFDEPPFSLFVLELPLRAACAPVTVSEGSSDATERISSRPRLCRRA